MPGERMGGCLAYLFWWYFRRASVLPEQRNLGILHLAFFFLAAFIIPTLDKLLAYQLSLVLLISVAFLSMPKATFDAKYNKIR